MDLAPFEFQIFVSLVVVLGAAFVALICNYLKGNKKQLRERNIGLLVSRQEQERIALLEPAGRLVSSAHSHLGAAPAVESEEVTSTDADSAIADALRPDALARVAYAPKLPRPEKALVEAPSIAAANAPRAVEAESIIDLVPAVADIVAKLDLRIQDEIERVAEIGEPAVDGLNELRQEIERIVLIEHQGGSSTYSTASTSILHWPAPVPGLHLKEELIRVAHDAALAVSAEIPREDTPHGENRNELMAEVISDVINAMEIPSEAAQEEIAVPEAPVEAHATDEQIPARAPQFAVVPAPVLASAEVERADATDETDLKDHEQRTSQLLLPAGMQDRAVYNRLLAIPNAMSGVVVIVAVNDYARLASSAGTNGVPADLVPSLESLMHSFLRDGDFAARIEDDKWIFIFRHDEDGQSRRRVAIISEKLWDCQLRHLGVSNLNFSWAAVDVKSEPFPAAVAAANDRLDSTRQSRNTATLDSLRKPRKAVNA